MTKEETIKYWTDASDIDFLAMDSLFNIGHYVDVKGTVPFSPLIKGREQRL
ncbi:MAG: hypothetical protein AABY54_01080 [Deltaproteobacteria bacterium]